MVVENERQNLTGTSAFSDNVPDPVFIHGCENSGQDRQAELQKFFVRRTVRSAVAGKTAVPARIPDTAKQRACGPEHGPI